MKKFLCLVLAALLLCATFAAAAETATETPAFDKSKLSGSSLYTYDKFAKTWNIQAHYVKEYRDATILVYLLMFDNYVTEAWGPELRVVYFDKEAQHYNQVTAFRAIVGEQMFCWEKLAASSNRGAGYAFGGDVLKAFSKALLTGNEVAFQIDHTDKYGTSWTSTIDPVDSTALADLRAMAQLLEDSNAWYVDTSPYVSDYYYGATME